MSSSWIKNKQINKKYHLRLNYHATYKEKHTLSIKIETHYSKGMEKIHHAITNRKKTRVFTAGRNTPEKGKWTRTKKTKWCWTVCTWQKNVKITETKPNETYGRNRQIQGRLGGSVGSASASGHDLGILRSRPAWGSLLSSVSVSLSPSLCSLSLS